ncbi:MAG TPA: hypothetical protein VEW71_07480 [Allosphingosinicella sp.]|nr:hypothetical protein [Allosphingosinicella sp.]
MTKEWTEARLRALSPYELQRLYANAREKDSPEADEIIERIFQYRLLDSIGGGLPRHHPTIQAIEKICRSPEGMEAALNAAKAGEAPIAGVDPLLRLNVREYGYHDTTSWAGTFVAEEVEAEGWIRRGRKSLPGNCVAKTAAFFVAPGGGD